MPQISFVVNDKFLETLEELKQTFGVTSNAEVVHRALALAQVAAENASADHTVTIGDGHDKSHKVLLSG
ncbi:MAG: hypothetical protein IPM60_02810 [Rhodospirillales bacterium]|nr:hypothetical protein [Rhodospirillales bacterium]